MASGKQQPVAAGGGFMSSAKAAPLSKDTQDLMKVMMKESNLTAVQRRQLGESVKAGKPLPRQCGPAGSRHTPSKTTAQLTQQPHRKAAQRQGIGGGLRSKEAIVSSGAYKPEAALPTAYTKPLDSEKKERLQDEMTFGGISAGAKTRSRTTQRPPSPQEPPDRFDEVLEEIEERKVFLADMEAVGRGGEYRAIINTEISLKIRELDEIDRKRSSALRDRLL
ncbi:UPF0193 protein EVG1 homolog [Sycon ciliatum]|uniref:UPF0193 protein EVG1 homolog n=1 Tax=Sycon ciliatum TaxID=27933 RepID=UPI0031F62A79